MTELHKLAFKMYLTPMRHGKFPFVLMIWRYFVISLILLSFSLLTSFCLMLLIMPNIMISLWLPLVYKLGLITIYLDISLWEYHRDIGLSPLQTNYGNQYIIHGLYNSEIEFKKYLFKISCLTRPPLSHNHINSGSNILSVLDKSHVC